MHHRTLTKDLLIDVGNKGNSGFMDLQEKKLITGRKWKAFFPLPFFPSKLFMDITGSTFEIAKGVVFRCKGEQKDVIASRYKDVEDMALVNLDVVIESASIVK